MANYKFRCTYCEKGYIREAAYLKHRCKEMERAETFDTAIGQMAFGFYQHWLQLKHKSILTPDSFKGSRYFDQFVRFAELVKRTNMPRPKTFIWFMIDKNYQPAMWTMLEVYNKYLEFLDHTYDPYARVIDTINTFDKIKKEHNCHRSEVFDKITPPALIHYITTREMSPWMLLHCSKFHKYVQNVSDNEREYLNALIHPNYWRVKFTQNPEIVEHIKGLAKRLKL